MLAFKDWVFQIDPETDNKKHQETARLPRDPVFAKTCILQANLQSPNFIPFSMPA